MLLIIDVDEKLYEAAQQEDVVELKIDPKIIADGIRIPEELSNGRTLEIMFPDAKTQEIYGSFDKTALLGYRTWLGGRSQDFLRDWWEAPYRSI